MLANLIALLTGFTTIFNIICAVAVVFYERKNPSATLAWMMLVLLVPYVGFIFYLLFGMESKRVREFAQKARNDEALVGEYAAKEINGFHSAVAQYELIINSQGRSSSIKSLTGTTHFDDIVYLNLVSGQGLYSTNNRVDIFHEGADKFDALMADIENAKKFIHMEYYIFKADSLGHRVLDALAKKAAEGVEVRLLVDGMGCSNTPRSFFAPLLANGGELGIYVPRRVMRINFRNHRKLVVIDGVTGYNGGLNIGNEYIGNSRRFGHWRDCHLRITGEAVRQLQMRFLMDWNFASPKKITLDNKYFPEVGVCGNTSMQVVSSGPDTKWYSIVYAMAKMINEADHSIYIQTPYFVPDDNILESLRIAALSGKDVRIMIPGRPDHPFVYGAAMSYLGELIPAGVKCYRYENGFVHSKLLIIDGLISTTGTANIDVRSFRLNFETNSFIYSEEVSSKLEAQFMKDLQDCTEIDYDFYLNRSRMDKVKESVSRLLSPLL